MGGNHGAQLVTNKPIRVYCSYKFTIGTCNLKTMEGSFSNETICTSIYVLPAVAS